MLGRVLFGRWTQCVLLLAAAVAPLFGQENGKLQLHFMNVGQGDGAVLISPLGEVVLFDDGVRNNCDLPVSYLQQLGVTTVDYHIASHYHDDHIGCAEEVLTAYPLQKSAIDRGESGTTDTFERYEEKVRPKRQQATKDMSIILDEGSTHPVKIEFLVVNGNGFPVKNENDKSVVALVRFGVFEAEIGGDLSGARTSSYRDVETPVAAGIPQVEVYKVHHHGSEHSSNATWLSHIKPMIAIISAGVNNKHKHPTQAALKRLHDAGVRTYWTTAGSGHVQPQGGLDVVGGNIIVEVAPGSTTFSVTHSGMLVDTYNMWEAGAGAATLPAFAWSKRSNVYHFANCFFVRNISPANLEQGSAAPAGKTLHSGCPR